MACFIVPAVEAVVATVATKVIEKKIKSEDKNKSAEAAAEKLDFTHKIKWLSNLLWGGSALLAFEHVWHGEVVPWFPFLTAALNPADKAEMLHEMSTVGVSMAVLVTAVWAVIAAATKYIEVKSKDNITADNN